LACQIVSEGRVRDSIRPSASYRPCYTPWGKGRQGALDSPGAHLPVREELVIVCMGMRGDLGQM